MSEAEDKAKIKELLKGDQVGVDYLPYMNPDLIDDFVTWLYERVDLRSFAKSDIQVKYRYRRQFLRSLPIEKLQYALHFAE